MKIIGLSGKARVGKDTVADWLVKERGYTKVSWATPLKEMAMKYFGLTRDECYANKTARSRKILQALGTDFCRTAWTGEEITSAKNDELLKELIDMEVYRCFNLWRDAEPYEWINTSLLDMVCKEGGTDFLKELGENYWVERMFKDNAKLDNIVISDTRFLNEVEAIKERGGEVFRIHCGKAKFEGAAEHISETALDNYEAFDKVIYNDGTIDDLYVYLRRTT